ncbi:hypothetical protein BO94DRAFT_626874 [Aspergillus sclerotioniger CBS 115572]|uniref:Uncharacterized protein n=1 Tax=Aspergillus sclerotioniger CBS 115572 TaxID=1450535 RepID=A0A317VW98_9EURO|nr:hypothetical protein BO94DRAFT_626874 [Aspergillus sclerotioniger CBS 115572]PWY77272.1 hypothetical protein BO94DRAFT_626874 [Aspergillus sclerotioniger CBS 115572]
MQLKSILATAITLCASGALATIDIAYTVNGDYYTQTVQTESLTPLDQPGNITTWQGTADCLLYEFPSAQTHYVSAGTHTLDPAVYADDVLCL